jgi:acyl carrier protein
MPLPVTLISIDHLCRVFADVFEIPIEDVRTDLTPENVETWDSTRHLSLVIALEQEFGVQFEPEEIEQLLSFELIQSLVSCKCAGRAEVS